MEPVERISQAKELGFERPRNGRPQPFRQYQSLAPSQTDQYRAAGLSRLCNGVSNASRTGVLNHLDLS